MSPGHAPSMFALEVPPEDSDLYEESDEEVRESMRQQAREGVLGTMALPGYHGKGFPNQQAGGSSSSTSVPGGKDVYGSFNNGMSSTNSTTAGGGAGGMNSTNSTSSGAYGQAGVAQHIIY